MDTKNDTMDEQNEEITTDEFAEYTDYDYDFQNEDIDLSPSELEYLAQNPKAGKICNKLSMV